MENNPKTDSINNTLSPPLQFQGDIDFFPSENYYPDLDDYGLTVKENTLKTSIQRQILRYPSEKSFGTVRSGRLSFSPFSHHVSNGFEGADIAGYGGQIKINDHIALNMSAYVSSGYFGPMVPERIGNASLSLGVSAKITDRLSMNGWGILSANSGINPVYMPMVGAAKGFGVGMSYKLTENIILHGVYQRSYYQGEWHNSFFVLPGYMWKIKKR